MSGGPKSKVLFFCIFSMAGDTNAHWEILNGQTQNSPGDTSSYMSENDMSNHYKVLQEEKKTGCNPFWRVY